MVTTTADPKDFTPDRQMLGGYAALAEGAWMGSPQSADVLDALHTSGFRLRWPRLTLTGLFTREFTIAEATVLLMASFFISAMLGAIRQVLFNVQFGAGDVASAYYAGFRLPDALFSLIAGGALSSAMIPVLLATQRRDGSAAAWHLTSLVLTALMSFVAVISTVGIIFTPFFVHHVLAPGFDSETSALTVRLTRIMMVQPLILALGSVATAVLNSRNQFFLTALSVMSHNFALIAGIGAARLIPGLGIYGPTLGVVGGAILQVVILLPGLRDHSGGIRLMWDRANSGLREVVALLIPNGLAVGVGYAGFILDTAFASGAKESAALPAIQNAWLMVGLPIALLGQAVGQAAFPLLSVHATDGDWRRMKRTLLISLAAVVALAVPALLGLIVLGKPMIQAVFQHGKFDASAGDLTAKILTAYAIALPAYVATEVITRGLIALHDTRTPLATNSAQLAARALIIALLIQDRGAVAIPIAFAVSASLETIALGTILILKLLRRSRGVAPAKA
jgi:putative peptidoglycan lipid II flippase